MASELPTCHISISVTDKYTTAASVTLGGSLNVIDGLDIEGFAGEIDIDDVMLALRQKTQAALDEIRSTLFVYIGQKRKADREVAAVPDLPI